jgi:predicted nucleotidyltransferase
VTKEDVVGKIRQVLARRGDETRFAILFGSAAMRGPSAARDLDVAVSLRNAPSLFDLGALASELEAAAGMDVDIVDIDEASTLLRWEIARHGQALYVQDRDAWLRFIARAALDWDDLRPYFERESDGLHRSLEEWRWSASISSAPRSDV